ncbi:RING-type domain-containing protein [Plasmodiophora brassicae]
MIVAQLVHLVLLTVASAQPLASVFSASGSSGPVIFEGAAGALPISIPFSLDWRNAFAFIVINDTRPAAIVNIGDGSVALPLSTSRSTQFFLSTNPEYDGRPVDAACNQTGMGPCKMAIAIRGPAVGSIPIVVRALQGTLLQPGHDTPGQLSTGGAAMAFGLRFQQNWLPALVTLQPAGGADVDLVVCSFDGQMDGVFDRKFPLPGNENQAPPGSAQRVLVQSLASSFIRFDVPLHSNGRSDFLLRFDSNYDSFDVYQLSLAGTIGAAILLALCMIAALCVILARRNHGVMIEMYASPVIQGLSPDDIDANTQKKKAGDLRLEPADSQCVVCLDDYSSSDDLLVLPCGHHFHNNCIRTWFTNHEQCPLCNRRVNQASSPSVAVPIVRQ